MQFALTRPLPRGEVVGYILSAQIMKATPAGTHNYANKFQLPSAHFRTSQNLTISSIGIGTYLGEPDEPTDTAYRDAIVAAVENGCNLIDTAINYRFQRSERSIGAALQQLIKSGKFSREEIIVCSKGGFLTFDGSFPPNSSRYFQEEYIQPGICKPDDIVANCHCMTPAYLENQLDRSLRNLQLDCIDVYFIHNPETQLSEISRQDFLRRMLAAFKMLEKKVAEGKIQFYGTATWNGYRDKPNDNSYLSLEELIGLARNAGGEEHHFRALQLPYNFAMPEALLEKNQNYGSAVVSPLEAARYHDMIVLSSASILQGKLSRNLPSWVSDFLPDFETDAQRSIQFVRSTPGVTTALIGMSNIRHVLENLKVAQKPPGDWAKLSQMFHE
jgi:aryl-alcohol dehydrogenase-like predicted oxidoreductase